MGRLGASVVKIEAPGNGDLGRSAMPAMTDPEGRSIGATFMRNNLSKRSVVVDLKQPAGRDLVMRLAPRFDVVAENFRAGAAERLGIAYADVAAVHDTVVYLSISGFGRPVGDLDPSPYDGWPALASIVEAMSGAYEFKRPEGQPPIGSPMGGLGDIVTALFAVIGTLAGLRQRDRTGRAQQVDVAMLDAMVAVLDVVPNFWSMGMPIGTPWPGILHGFRARDGWFMLQVLRAHQWPDLAKAIGKPEWAEDARFATPQGWLDHLESDIRPALESWASTKSKREACDALNAAGLVAGPVATDSEVVADPHLAARQMLVEHPRTDGIDQPVLIPGLPVKFGAVSEGPETRVPWIGEHTDEVLGSELGLGPGELRRLRADGVIV
jgi:crotonobetainyl-CoA:carnitine CoA-transferase CaiB-like acyl-CoA transferase